MKRSDISNETWELAKREMKIAIISHAVIRGMISYSELLPFVCSLKLNIENIDDRSLMAQMLGEISLEEDKIGHGMLSAIVVHKNGDMEPGQGFYHYAKILGHDTSDKLKFWVNEIHKVHSHWVGK